ncbi:hypothetical protein E3D00_00755 [Swingsia samuiensis]|uniref:Uncharacterized protein n=1 Tax=Swingsia samuiensis TaxID=1293412 RepID=A0A4Y6UJY6_9PROT|nr:hypothetical protein E3D00_00755 [Swingsia samuiensis]
MRRLLMIVPAFLLMLVVVRSGLLDISYDKLTFSSLKWFDNTSLVEHLRLVVVNDGLTDLPKNCLVFAIDGTTSENTPNIDVLGRHGADCPGDKRYAEKLFSIKVNRSERTIQTDAGSPGSFRFIQP